ncbi:hypothetical protein TrVE_jg4862 [Triparma verrucosa]|uniref:Uncharacterized protein n=1 Tax=Triparma verrucosa TaxID=1606542 RepID=A0A9W6Z9V6_9STRA|nr:hypothetical protein TrVE_jg4862 [Triparma verrucosa]
MDSSVTEHEYLAQSVQLLKELLKPDCHGNTAILLTSPKLLGLSSAGKRILKKVSATAQKSLSRSNSNSPTSKQALRSPLEDIVKLFLSPVASATTDLVIKQVLGHDYTEQPFETTCKTIAIQLCHNIEATDFIIFIPKHTHYSSLAVDDQTQQSKRILSLKEAIKSIHELIELERQQKLDQWTAERPNVKKRVALLQTHAEKLRKDLESATSLAACWALQKEVDMAEAEYDEARLQTIPPACSIQLVGAGFKVGVGSIWLENLVAPFVMQTIKEPEISVHMKIGGTSPRSEASTMGVVSFYTENVYLRADNFPTLRLDAFSAKCDFTSDVPIVYKKGRKTWKVGSKLSINLKKIEPKITMSGGSSVKPPQTLIRYAVEQVIKIIITKQLKQLIPPELGLYLETVPQERMNSVSGTLSIGGPHTMDIESVLSNDSVSAERARKLLKLSREQATHLITFANNFVGVDIVSAAKLANYVKTMVIHENSGESRAIAPILVTLWQLSYDMYSELNGGGRAPAIDIKLLFCEDARRLSQNPIVINCELSHMDVSLQVQTFLKALSNFMTRAVYENFGGKGVVVDEEDEQESEDELLKGSRKNINSVMIPLRRAFLILAANMSRMICSVSGKVNNVIANTSAELRLECSNLEVLGSPSLPATMLDFLTRKYTVTCNQGGDAKVRERRFFFEMVRLLGGLEGEGEGGDVSVDHSVAPLTQDFNMRGFFQNMASKVIYNPLVIMEMDTIGMVELNLMESFFNKESENTEEALQQDAKGLAGKPQPLQVHFTSELMLCECKFMVLLKELVIIVTELLRFGGADFDSVAKADDDEKMMSDLREKLARIIRLVLGIIDKHTSTEKFKFLLSNNMKIASDEQGEITIELEGNLSGDSDRTIPLSLEWETTFIDVVNDFKAVILEFRRNGGEEEGDDGGRRRALSARVEKTRRSSAGARTARRLSKFFGF